MVRRYIYMVTLTLIQSQQLISSDLIMEMMHFVQCGSSQCVLSARIDSPSHVG